MLEPTSIVLYHITLYITLYLIFISKTIRWQSFEHNYYSLLCLYCQNKEEKFCSEDSKRFLRMIHKLDEMHSS